MSDTDQKNQSEAKAPTAPTAKADMDSTSNDATGASSNATGSLTSPSSNVEIEDVTQEEEEKIREMLKAQKLASFDRQESIGLSAPNTNQDAENNNTASNRRLTDPKVAIEHASELKEKGNRAFQQADFNTAYEDYTAALAAIHFIHSYSFSDTDDADAKLQDKWKQLCINLHSNIAACCLMKKDFDGVILHTTEVLQLDPNHLKALTRRGKAYASTGEDGLAMIDLLRASKIGGDAIKNEVDPFIYTIQKRIMENAKSEKQKAREEKERLRQEAQKAKERENVRRFAELFEKSVKDEETQKQNERDPKELPKKYKREEKSINKSNKQPIRSSPSTSSTLPTSENQFDSADIGNSKVSTAENNKEQLPKNESPSSTFIADDIQPESSTTSQISKPESEEIDATKFFQQIFGQPQRSPYHVSSESFFGTRRDQPEQSVDVPNNASRTNAGYQQPHSQNYKFLQESEDESTDTESEDESALDQLLRSLQRSAYEGKAREEVRLPKRRNTHLMNIENKLASVINDRVAQDSKRQQQRLPSNVQNQELHDDIEVSDKQSSNPFSTSRTTVPSQSKGYFAKASADEDDSNLAQPFIVSYPSSDDELECDTHSSRKNNIYHLPEAESENDLLNAVFLSLLGVPSMGLPRTRNPFNEDHETSPLFMPLLSSFIKSSDNDHDEDHHDHLYGGHRLSKYSMQNKFKHHPLVAEQRPSNHLLKHPSDSYHHAHHHPSPFSSYHRMSNFPYGVPAHPVASQHFANQQHPNVNGHFAAYPYSSPFSATPVAIPPSTYNAPHSFANQPMFSPQPPFPVDILEFASHYQIDAFVPVKAHARKNIRVYVDDFNTLHISCPQQRPTHSQNARIISAESPYYQELHRALPVPKNSIPERLTVNLHDGMLSIQIPKRAMLNPYH